MLYEAALSDLSPSAGPLDIAVVGSGVSGLSAAWLLSRRHRVTLYEREARLGGHSHTVEATAAGEPVAVDMGFIVYNEANYPNLVRLFEHLGVASRPSDMSFGVSLEGGRLEYGSQGLFAQRRNLFRPRFWGMLNDLSRFYREAPGHACALDQGLTSLGDYLRQQGYGRAFQDDHLLPQAAAIWSTSARNIREFPAATFIRFCQNHGLLELNLAARPQWRTVEGGSRTYVQKLAAAVSGEVRSGRGVLRVRRDAHGVDVHEASGETRRFDHVVLATHADEALALLDQPTNEERALLGAFRYTRNRAVLHTDTRLMPRRRACWSSWNYVGRRPGHGDTDLCVTYWMNRLQGLPDRTPLFVTLNPGAIEPAGVIHSQEYEHPLFDAAAVRAQRELWSLQGLARTWFCGAYFGSGFHEDGLQAGLAVAEQLGGVRRPWSTAESWERILRPPPPPAPGLGMAMVA
ncbi:NAD(P)/FAD-dependent oxidoreductase [Caulobacter sp. 17J80-11]|uniref:NAD(P)/FAD-dependent oxidoreductase n=1 Tax=Caulobacter sp. 17J80-11 TaxID=2763502 RepID=UPI002105746A|nr:NAD(P)/FAD-dependent oxidoreductase [Caulobacter sp. 17J80-11]